MKINSINSSNYTQNKSFKGLKHIDMSRAQESINDMLMELGKDGEIINPAIKGIKRLKEYLEGFSDSFYNRLSKNSEVTLKPFASFDDGRLNFKLAVGSKLSDSLSGHKIERLISLPVDSVDFLLSDVPVNSFAARFRKRFEGVLGDPKKAMSHYFDRLLECAIADNDRLLIR